VIDDHPAGRRVLATQMRSWGIDVDEAGGAKEALEHLRAAARDRPYALALVDQEMPGTSGLELAEIMRAEPRHRTVGLVLLTTGPADPRICAEAGFRATLPKPVRVSQLRKVLSNAIDPQAADPAGQEPAVPPRGLGTLLVVEDHPINQEVAAGLIAKLGYSFHLAGDGAEALAALENGSYDAVLMDCHMPEMDGFQATREIRRREAGGSHIPIIAMTAGALIEDREKCTTAGMDDYLVKPIKQGELESVLARWVPVRGAEESAQSDPGDGVLDPDQLAQLRQLSIGNGDPLAKLIALFVEQAGSEAKKLQEASDRNDRADLKIIAHRLKGGAATMGAARAATACETLEQAAAQGGPTGGAVEGVLAELERATTALRALAAGDSRSSG